VDSQVPTRAGSEGYAMADKGITYAEAGAAHVAYRRRLDLSW
jgi:hypothetical protein